MFYIYICNEHYSIRQKKTEVIFFIKWFVKQCKQSERTNKPTKQNGLVHIQQRLESHEE